MARLACIDHKADWIINSDADEFWWSETGTLKNRLEAIPDAVDAVVVPRSNLVPRPQGEEDFFRRMVIRETHSLNSLGGPLPPKVCHRAFPDVEVAQGNHSISLEKGLHVAKDSIVATFLAPNLSPGSVVLEIAPGHGR